MACRIRQGTTKIDARRASSLLFPIAAFLQSGGMSSAVALDIFATALKKVSSSPVGRRMVPIGHPTQYADIVAMWARNKRFLDRSGWPRTLEMDGRAGFSALVKSAAGRVDPAAVLSVLMRYGNVRRTKQGTLKLVQSFFYASGPKTMALEPVAYFLGDANSTLSNILRRSKGWRGPDLFWQKTESARISEATAKRFMAFAKERGFVFLDELDEWLEANSDPNKAGNSRQRRVGLGIFSIYSDREPMNNSAAKVLSDRKRVGS